jgi:hypothetical protein
MATVHHSNTIGAYDAKTRFSELLDQVQSGEEITITKHKIRDMIDEGRP